MGLDRRHGSREQGERREQKDRGAVGHSQKKLTQLGKASLDSVVPGRGIKTLSQPNKHSYPTWHSPTPLNLPQLLEHSWGTKMEI
ncbi:MAG: hypothetical protein HRU34_07840 [Richelia sp.]|nr:hypothetical protein [Richelia sp.]